jgi:crossover junction endodeoxyribonuclease RusA
METVTALALPYPISANRYWRSFRGRQVVSAEARAYKELAAWLGKQAGIRPAAGPIGLTLVYHPKKPKRATTRPVRRMDCSNVVKVAEDALNGVAFFDDSQVTELHVIVGEPVPDGALKVFVERKEPA